MPAAWSGTWTAVGLRWGGDVCAIPVGGIVVRGRRDLTAPCLGGGRGRALEELRGLREIAARGEQRRGDDDRCDPAPPAASPTVRARRFDANFRWSSSRSRRACSLRSALVSRRPSPGRRGASLLNQMPHAWIAEAYRPYRWCTGRLVLPRRGCEPILLASSPVSTAGQPAEEGGRVSDTKHDQVVRVPAAEERSGLDRFFRISERGSTIRVEIVAGITTWLTMAYILFLNPQILGFAAVPDLQPLGLPFGAVLTVTALVAGIARSRWGSGRTTRSRSRRGWG